jgi:hypothetical protein
MNVRQYCVMMIEQDQKAVTSVVYLTSNNAIPSFSFRNSLEEDNLEVEKLLALGPRNL